MQCHYVNCRLYYGDPDKVSLERLSSASLDLNRNLVVGSELSHVVEHQLRLPGASEPPYNECLCSSGCGLLAELRPDLLVEDWSTNKRLCRLKCRI